MNTKKGVYNILVNILSQVITLGLGIVIPRLVLVNLGSEANGLMNTINQILAYVALLEAGVGAATLQALYSPVSKNDKDCVNGVLAATNYFYKRTGTLYFFVILGLTVLFPVTLKTELPRQDVMWVVFLSGMPGVVNYYFQGKFRLLLQAEGKGYILTALSTVIHFLTSVSKIILLLNGFDIVALQVMYLVFTDALYHDLHETALHLAGYEGRARFWGDLPEQKCHDPSNLDLRIQQYRYADTDLFLRPEYG